MAGQGLYEHVGLDVLLDELAYPSAFPQRPARVRVIQTHISAVFIGGEEVYKIKKPIRLSFLDYGTLELRHACCEAEVRLNRRLAPDVYLGVVPVTRGPEGLRFGGEGTPVEYAVHMRRLSDTEGLPALLAAGAFGEDQVAELGRFLARFHAGAARGAKVASFGRWDVVAGNCRENFEQLESLVGEAISLPVFERLRAATERKLLEHRSLIEERARRGLPCDTHGDLRVEHVYWRPGDDPPFRIIDCIEFNDRFRYADPIADVAFLVMDMRRAGYTDLAGVLAEAYLEAARDPDGAALLSLYTAYRATVRCKVQGLKLLDREIGENDRECSRDRARSLSLLALDALVPSGERPCLVLLSGLPGTGKSVLASSLRESAGMTWIRSDEVRKEIATRWKTGADGLDSGIYAEHWSDTTYAACLERAEAVWLGGGRVLIDACFLSRERRRTFLDAAQRWSVPACVLHLQADPQVVRERLEGREDDASDADWAIYQHLSARWESFGPQTAELVVPIDANGEPSATRLAAETGLHSRALL